MSELVEIKTGVWVRNDVVSTPVPTYELSSVTVQVKGAPAATSLSGDFIANIGDTISISAILVGGVLITYPESILKLPVTRYADDMPTTDEIYFTATIVDGTILATGVLPRSGDWKVTIDRTNRALYRANIGWEMSGDDVEVLV